MRAGTEHVQMNLAESVAHILDRPPASICLESIYRGALADSTEVFLTRDAARRPEAVVLMSPSAAPSAVDHAMRRAIEAADRLGADTGRRVLKPIGQGSVDGRSFALLPYCQPLSTSRIGWRLQRLRVRPTMLDWLCRVVGDTVHDVPPSELEPRFIVPLRNIKTLASASTGLRDAAAVAVRRIERGDWRPRGVLMHGDLWKGNLLVRPKSPDSEPQRWTERLAVIDWAGARLEGYAMYDLVRLADSLALDPSALHREAVRHCRLLACELTDAPGHLLAALGGLLEELEEFPLPRFVAMAEASYRSLSDAIAR